MLQSEMQNCLHHTDFKFERTTSIYHGKVRDVYVIDNNWMLMVVSDRISAFDFVMPRPIPYKGQVLNQLAAHFLEATKDICPNWVLSVPDPNVTIGRLCQTFKVEMVIRGYLTGHAWREYSEGKRVICGVAMPEGMKENEAFPEPIITPTTKSDHGHDLDISREEILKQGIVSEADYLVLEKYTRALYKRGSEMAAEKGLILVDTKYEFGKADDVIYLIDEIHTPDSSRYFYADGYAQRLENNEPQRQLSKEFLRQWLIANDFQGKEGQVIPTFSDEFINEISERYIELYEQVSGKKFVKGNDEDVQTRVLNNCNNAIKMLVK
jgi:phosphoribosylaminoimidazole-succinocarboxamide synthase